MSREDCLRIQISTVHFISQVYTSFSLPLGRVYSSTSQAFYKAYGFSPFTLTSYLLQHDPAVIIFFQIINNKLFYQDKNSIDFKRYSHNGRQCIVFIFFFPFFELQWNGRLRLQQRYKGWGLQWRRNVCLFVCLFVCLLVLWAQSTTEDYMRAGGETNFCVGCRCQDFSPSSLWPYWRQSWCDMFLTFFLPQNFLLQAISMTLCWLKLSSSLLRFRSYHRFSLFSLVVVVVVVAVAVLVVVVVIEICIARKLKSAQRVLQQLRTNKNIKWKVQHNTSNKTRNGYNYIQMHHHHQSLSHEGRWGTTDDFATSFLHFPCSLLLSGTCRTPGLSIP